MSLAARISFPAALAGLVLAGCAPVPAGEEVVSRVVPQYEGVETRLLDDDLVNFHVRIRDAASARDLEEYAECAAAQYALIRGYGFARHLRTNVHREGGLWHADAVYTISAAIPRGLRTIDAEVVAAACAENGIPTV
jgi:hypothetical protein